MTVRTGLRLFLLVALIAAFLPLTASVSWTLGAPETLHERVSMRLVVPLREGAVRAEAALSPEQKLYSASLRFPSTHLGIEWRGSEDPPPQVRTSVDGETWLEWRSVVVSEDMSDHEEGHWFSSLIPGADARFVQVRAHPEQTNVRASAINTRDGARQLVPVARDAVAATPQPNVISRAQWGADESLRSGSPSFARVRKLIVHHTVTTNDDPDPAGTVRAIYSYHTQSRGWNDIGYNFLVDPNGNVYEGRFARAYAPRETPNGENRNGMGVVGAHAANHNTGSVGVSLLGDFTSVSPRPAAMGALVNLLAWKADRHAINPFGNDGGSPNFAGHRDVGITGCPGGHLYNALPSIRDAVEQRIQETTGTSAPSMPTGTEVFPRAFSRDLTPNATGSVSRTATRVDLTFDGEQPLSDRTFVLPASGGAFSLTDQDYHGLALPEDRYSIRAVAYDGELRASPVAPVADDYVITLGEVPATGYWIMGADGGIFSYGSARFFGSTGGMRLNAPLVGMDATKTGDGYWMVANDGGVFSFGGARFNGSTGGIRLNRPIVDIVARASGAGYRMVASDGGVFAFGDAAFHGSTGSIALNRPIVGMAETASGAGYWMVASDGGIFAFGDAEFYGSTGGMVLNRPIVGLAPTKTGRGYWLVAADGGVFTFGDAGFFGSVPSRSVNTTAVAISSTFTGNGYYVLSQGGSVYAFGDAPHYGSVAGSGINATVRDISVVP